MQVRSYARKTRGIMRTKLTLGAVAMLVVMVAAMAAAQTPSRLVRYNGVVRDAQGQPKTGAATLTFAIYGEAEGGAALWAETQAVTLDADGRYTVLLGAMSAQGMPVELFA